MMVSDMTAEEFVSRKKTGRIGAQFEPSKYDRFRALVAKKLNIPVANVDIFTVMDYPSKPRTVDVRFAAHNSPYYHPVRLTGVINSNWDEVSQ